MSETHNTLPYSFSSFSFLGKNKSCMSLHGNTLLTFWLTNQLSVILSYKPCRYNLVRSLNPAAESWCLGCLSEYNVCEHGLGLPAGQSFRGNKAIQQFPMAVWLVLSLADMILLIPAITLYHSVIFQHD